MSVSRMNRLFLAGGYVCLLLTAAVTYGAVRKPAPPAPAALPPGLETVAARQGMIAVVFRLRDCGAGLERLTAWNPAPNSTETPVVGFVLESPRNEGEIREVLSGSGIDFAVHRSGADYFGALLSVSGYAHTPVVVVLDAERRVRLIVPLDENFGRQDAARVRELARSLQPRPAGAVEAGE
jgi:hypothetical protein